MHVITVEAEVIPTLSLLPVAVAVKQQSKLEREVTLLTSGKISRGEKGVDAQLIKIVLGN